MSTTRMFAALLPLAALALLSACTSAPAPADPAPTPTTTKLVPEVAAPLEFRDPDPGPRAPTAAAFALEIGASSFPDVRALVDGLGLECSDTSIRAMMEAKREAERKKVADRGEDAVSSASWMKKKSKREANPQVRFSCPKVQSAQLQDRSRPPSAGRLLFVFDSDELPLRHVSYQRSHADHDAALADLQDAIAAMTAVYGAPTSTTGEIPEPVDGKAHFLPNRQIEARWEYSDLVVRVTAIQFGPTKVTIGERIEVPHGIRPDAPRLARPPGAASPTPAPTPAATGDAVDLVDEAAKAPAG